jgi:hypothetical protein
MTPDHWLDICVGLAVFSGLVALTVAVSIQLLKEKKD